MILEKNKIFDLQFILDKNYFLAGIDEAGRGPLAGPVVAAAVIFEKEVFIPGVNDSKQLSENLRESLDKLIKEKAISFAYGIVDEKEIDRINILQATLKAMKIAVENLKTKPNLIIIDGNKSFNSKIPTKTIVKGDAKSFSIAAASILAKVKRDEIMKNAAISFPQYYWDKNKGYGTKQHIDAIKKHSYSPLHRITFLKNIIQNNQETLL
ncbi:MAG: ribonuclease HII [Ignavibacteriae bacterium]|nr:ribonuclease HII [Ignavibacteriota bacterium]